MQLAQMKVLETRLIIKSFKLALVQALNIKEYLTLINFESDKKAD